MTKTWNRRFFFYSPDDGGAGGADPAPADPTQTTVADNGNQGGAENNPAEPPKAPAYFSQMRKESREKYQSLHKYKTIEELAEAAMKADNVKEPDYTGYIKMPTAESTKEEIKDFLGKLGVPEGPDKYDIPKEENPAPIVSGMEKTLREAAFRSGMTDSQVKSMWGVFRALMDTATQQGEAMMKDRKENFDTRFEELFKDQYQMKPQRDAAVKESMNYFKTFLADTGLGKALEESGALYDERIVKALADYQKRNRGSYMHGQTGQSSPSQSTRLHYSEEFEKQFGRRR